MTENVYVKKNRKLAKGSNQTYKEGVLSVQLDHLKVTEIQVDFSVSNYFSLIMRRIKDLNLLENGKMQILKLRPPIMTYSNLS